jgi:hypothetical protein
MSTSGRGQANRLLGAVAEERRAIETILDRLESESEVSDPGERGRLVDELRERVAGHAASRRDLLYPRVSRDVPDGDSLVDLAFIGLDQVERTSGKIAGLSGAEPTFQPLVVKLAAEVQEHLDDEEESDVLPPLLDAVGVDGANELGDHFTPARWRRPRIRKSWPKALVERVPSG